jgi:AcrR family transcriptional regulator
MVAIAAELGVSQVALYIYVSGLDALKALVAEEIFLRWLLPIPLRGDRADLKAYLTPFSLSMWDLVEAHAGIAPYMLRRDMITERRASASGRRRFRHHYATIDLAAVHDCLSAPEAPETTSSGVPSHSPIDADHVQGVDALIIGALATLVER